MPQGESIPGLDAVRLNAAVLGFSFAASVVSALVFALIGGIGLTSRGARQALAAPTRVTIGRGARRAASTLVVAEIAFAVVLLIGAGLTLRSFSNLIAVDPGFTADGVLTIQFGLPPGRYPEARARRDLYDRAFAALEALPEIETVGAAEVTPLTGNNWTVPFERMDQPLPRGQRAPDVGWQQASSGYFRALHIPLRAGRLFDARDTPQTQSVVVIISEAIATRFFPGESPIGRRVRLGDSDAEIVGVVGDIRRAALTDQPRADMYMPFEQQPPGGTTLFLRTSGDPLLALPAVRSTLRTIEPGAVVFETRTLSDIEAASTAIARLAMRLLTGFAVIALALAAIGIYGVMSYSVRQRTRELGTRIALGASRGAIVRLVLGQAAIIGALGLAFGLVCGLAAARSLSTLLFGVPPWDPVTVAAGVAVLAATTLLASALPARRASRVDPARTLALE